MKPNKRVPVWVFVAASSARSIQGVNPWQPYSKDKFQIHVEATQNVPVSVRTLLAFLRNFFLTRVFIHLTVVLPISRVPLKYTLAVQLGFSVKPFYSFEAKRFG